MVWKKNILLIRDLYPGYAMRLYHNRNIVKGVDHMGMTCDLYCQYPELDLCDSHQPCMLVNNVLYNWYIYES